MIGIEKTLAESRRLADSQRYYTIAGQTREADVTDLTVRRAKAGDAVLVSRLNADVHAVHAAAGSGGCTDEDVGFT